MDGYLDGLWQSVLMLAVTGILYHFAQKWWREFRSGDRPHEQVPPPIDDTEQVLCPECGYDIRITPTRCPECGARPLDRRKYLKLLRTEWPSNPIVPRTPSPTESVQVVLSTMQPMEATFASQQLAARGMSATVKHVAAIGGPRDVTLVDRPIVFHVAVYEGDADSARAYLQSLKDRAQENAPVDPAAPVAPEGQLP